MNKGPYERIDRLIKQRRHDTYQERKKWSEPTLCSECGAVFKNGRWVWQEPPDRANETICPACRRIVDCYPAGYVEIKGSFFAEHRDEISNLILNIEEQEKNLHPMERLISITDEKDHTVVTTTGLHIARRIGEALSSAYKGDLAIRYADAEQRIRICWKR